MLLLTLTGISPLNGDSDTDNNTAWTLSAAARFSRSDWLYIATNGRDGTPPPGNLSVMFPWAGQLISRNGWQAGSQWSWFKVGPFGASVLGSWVGERRLFHHYLFLSASAWFYPRSKY